MPSEDAVRMLPNPNFGFKDNSRQMIPNRDKDYKDRQQWSNGTLQWNELIAAESVVISETGEGQAQISTSGY